MVCRGTACAAERGVRLTCPLGPGSPDSPCRQWERGQKVAGSPVALPLPPQPALTFYPFSPGRPATPGSPCREKTLGQALGVATGGEGTDPMSHAPGACRSGRGRCNSPLRRGARSSLESPGESEMRGSANCPLQGGEALRGSPTCPPPRRAPPSRSTGPADRSQGSTNGLRPLFQVLSKPPWHLVSFDSWQVLGSWNPGGTLLSLGSLRRKKKTQYS